MSVLSIKGRSQCSCALLGLAPVSLENEAAGDHDLFTFLEPVLHWNQPAHRPADFHVTFGKCVLFSIHRHENRGLALDRLDGLFGDRDTGFGPTLFPSSLICCSTTARPQVGVFAFDLDADLGCPLAGSTLGPHESCALDGGSVWAVAVMGDLLPILIPASLASGTSARTQSDEVSAEEPGAPPV